MKLPYRPYRVRMATAGDKGSVLVPREYQRLEGPWLNGVDPAGA
jgi:hypothetical protein